MNILLFTDKENSNELNDMELINSFWEMKTKEHAINSPIKWTRPLNSLEELLIGILKHNYVINDKKAHFE